MSAARILQILPPPQPRDTLREYREARDRAYRRATDPCGMLLDRNGAIPMRGAYTMPASGLERCNQ